MGTFQLSDLRLPIAIWNKSNFFFFDHRQVMHSLIGIFLLCNKIAKLKNELFTYQPGALKNGMKKTKQTIFKDIPVNIFRIDKRDWKNETQANKTK